MRMSERVENYLSDSQSTDIDEILEMLVKNIPQLKFKFIDECSIYDGMEDARLLCLEDYTKKVFENACDMIVNVIKSFEKGDDEELLRNW